jgi:NitT/TauT family transport system permease protein
MGRGERAVRAVALACQQGAELVRDRGHAGAAGVRLGLIRGVKGVVIGQLLVSIIGLGELFEIYSRNFPMKEFWALTVLLFAFAILASELIGMVERRVEYYAGSRG